MSALYAGIGCRRGCPAEEILALIARALAEVGAAEVTALATLEQKRHEAGLSEAAERLNKPLHYLSTEALASAEAKIETRSEAAARALDLVSVAEAAALAAAGPDSRLRLPRIQSERATCALAEATS
ncbi:MAG: cobalamin biosynthesis protein [Kiloniellales bacterium]